jgi:hypothetical protein
MHAAHAIRCERVEGGDPDLFGVAVPLVENDERCVRGGLALALPSDVPACGPAGRLESRERTMVQLRRGVSGPAEKA